jgi:hypothetical protein
LATRPCLLILPNPFDGPLSARLIEVFLKP